MNITELKQKNIVIWGTGREGKAAEAFIRLHLPAAAISFVDEADGEDISDVVKAADVIVKSPGVSLYHPLLEGKNVTSLMNLWFGQPHAAKTICITGTKGKSTTSALLGHILSEMGYVTDVVGNIGVPITQASEAAEYLVIETSSYQAANFDGMCDVGVVTSLYQEHLDWHKDVATYQRDKINLLRHARIKIAHPQVLETGIDMPPGTIICKQVDEKIPNEYLSRPHNLNNVAIALEVIHALGLDLKAAIAATAGFEGLAHRQQELGIKNDVLYVDDSIATTPQAAIAAMDVYRGRPVTLIVGGYDRGIDYAPLVDYLHKNHTGLVIGLGPSGRRILQQVPGEPAGTMQEAVQKAKAATPAGGVILLSPAAPSFGLFRDYVERGEAFARESGF